MQTDRGAAEGSRADGIAKILTPTRLLLVAVLIAAAVAGWVTTFALHQPWLGLKLAFDDKAGGAVVLRAEGPGAAIPIGAVLVSVAGGGDSLRLKADDFVVEPDGSLGTYDNYEVFLQRQARLAAIQGASEVAFTDTRGQAWSIQPAAGRPLASLGPDFWAQIIVGVFAWIISAAIWVFRPKETSARYLLLSGAATLTFACFAAGYSTREMALPAATFRWINDLNFLGGSLFGASLASLLLYYPRKLAPRWVGVAIVGVFVAWFVAQEVGLFHSMTMARRLLVVMAVLATFVLSGIHWGLTRRDPIARAALGWFLLSWVLGVSVFCLGVLAPQMFGVDTSGLQAYGFLLFLLVYGGLAFGILRFRLFDLGEWWARIIAWTLGLILLAGLDLLFLAGLRLSANLSLALALLVCGLVWLPFRGWIWTRIFRRQSRAADDRALFENVVAIGLTRSSEEQASLWAGVLRSLFDPLHLDTTQLVDAPRLEQSGLALLTPAVEGIPALRLEYARGGRSLFTPRDVTRAAELADMLRFVLRSRTAYEQGVAGERKRIASDIHDNLGASLLTALHSQSGERKDELIRESLSDLRSIVTDPARSDASLAEALALIRRETADRLAVSGVALRWPEAQQPKANLSSKSVHALRSLVREAVSNIIKHAGARQVAVSLHVEGGELLLEIADNGRGFDPAQVRRGAGLSNIEERAAAAGGSASWVGGTAGGARLQVRLPL